MKKLLFILCACLCACLVLSACETEPVISGDPVTDATVSTEETDETEETLPPPPPDPMTVIGQTEYGLIVSDPKTGAPIIAKTETNLGDFIADAYRTAADANIALVSASEIAAGIPQGEITLLAVETVLPTETALVTVRVSGGALLNALEVAYLPTSDEAAPDFLHLSGISLTLDKNKTPAAEKDEAGAFIGFIGERRVSGVTAGEVPLDPEAVYTVTFSEALPAEIKDVLKGEMILPEALQMNREAVIRYITDTLAGKIGETYENPFGDGRISVIPEGLSKVPASLSLLPQVYITTEEEITRAAYVTCAVTVYDPTGVYGDIYDSESTIKIRGNSTASGEKKPYNIKFSSKIELLGLGKGKKWSLLANLYDKTQIRNTLAFTFAENAGVNYVSDSAFAEVYVNGAYAGLYQICEPVDVSPTQVDIDTENNEFLLELEPRAGYSNPVSLTLSETGIILGYNDPEEPTAEQRAWLSTFMTSVEDALLSGDYDKVTECIDVESFARSYIVQELFKNVDYSVSSTRFYVKGGKLYEGPVWDFDLSSGNCSFSYYKAYNNADTTGLSYEGIYCVSIFNRYLFEYEEFKTLVSDLYTALQPVIVNLYEDNELGESRIDALLSEYRAEIDRNNTVWSTVKAYSLYEHKPVDGTYDGEIEYLKNWLRKRNEFLSEHYLKSDTDVS